MRDSSKSLQIVSHDIRKLRSRTKKTVGMSPLTTAWINYQCEGRTITNKRPAETCFDSCNSDDERNTEGREEMRKRRRRKVEAREYIIGLQQRGTIISSILWTRVTNSKGRNVVIWGIWKKKGKKGDGEGGEELLWRRTIVATNKLSFGRVFLFFSLIWRRIGGRIGVYCRERERKPDKVFCKHKLMMIERRRRTRRKVETTMAN